MLSTFPLHLSDCAPDCLPVHACSLRLSDCAPDCVPVHACSSCLSDCAPDCVPVHAYSLRLSDCVPDCVPVHACSLHLRDRVQDYVYLATHQPALTLYTGCCRYPPAEQLQDLWHKHRQPLLSLLLEVSTASYLGQG